MLLEIREQMILDSLEGKDVDILAYNNAEISEMFNELSGEFTFTDVSNESHINYGVSTLEKDTHYYNRQQKLQELEMIMFIVDRIKQREDFNPDYTTTTVSTLKDAYHAFEVIKDCGTLFIKSRRKQRILNTLRKLSNIDEYNTSVDILVNYLKRLKTA